MREVSTNGVRLLLRAMEQADISLQPLLARLQTDIEELRAPGGRVDWELWVEISEYLQARLGGPEKLEDFVCYAAAGPLIHQFQRVAQLVSSPNALYRLNSEWGVPNQYRNMRSTCQAMDQGRLCVTLTLSPGYRGSTAVFAGAVGILRGLPQLIGLAEATIHERDVKPHGARVLLSPPPSRTLLSQIKRVGRRIRGFESMLIELGEQEIELDQSRATLEQQVEAKRRTAAALQSSEARWQALAENAPGIILLLDSDARIVSASRKFHGIEPTALVSRSLAELIAPAARATLERALHDVQGQTTPRDVELQLSDGNGGETLYSCRLCAISEGDPLLCAFLTDITERRQIESELLEREGELQRAQRLEALGRLAGGVAHDFNNLLTVICGGTEMLLRERWLGAEQREELQQIQRAGERAVGLTRQLLAFSRQQVIAPEVLDVGQLVESARGMLERLVGDDIRLDFSSESTELFATIDRSQFEQILLNLTVNARDAMPHGGTLSINVAPRTLTTATDFAGSSAPPGEYVELAVKDGGFGIPLAATQRIFEPFFSTKPQGGGTGLGLAIVRGIVTQNRGHVGVESELGRGTVFRLLFPRCEAPAEAPPRPEVARASGGNERILLVEDDALVRTLVHRILNDRGYDVTVCERGAEALEHARREHFDLLLTDVVMPEISGPELSRLLTGIAPTLRVLFMSGYAEDEIVNRGVVNPGVTLLPKPFTPEALAFAVRNCLDDEHQGSQLKSG